MLSKPYCNFSYRLHADFFASTSCNQLLCNNMPAPFEIYWDPLTDYLKQIIFLFIVYTCFTLSTIR